MSAYDPFGGIQVTVTPSQSAFFAGETFSVAITFTNVRRPSTNRTQPRSASAAQSHRRAVHSVSSVPLARPPTSPGSPQTASASRSNFFVNEDVSKRKRRGLVGQLELQDPRLSAVTAEEGHSRRRKRSSPKSLSVSVTPSELVDRLVGKLSGSSPLSLEFRQEDGRDGDPQDATASSIQATPSRSREGTMPIHPTHPHARKQSIQDFQPQEVATPFSLSLDPIAEHSLVAPATPSNPSPLSAFAGTMVTAQPSPSGEPLSRAGNQYNSLFGESRMAGLANTTLGIGLGRPSSLTNISSRQPRSAFSSTFSPPGTEVLLWSYAQLHGTFDVDGTVVSSEVTEELRNRLVLNGVVGRGSMDIGTMSTPSSGFTSFATQRSPRSPALRHQRASPSILSSLPSFGLSSLFSPGRLSPFASPGLPRNEEDALPTLDLQPSVLAIDLALTPGESRTYSYTVELPPSLPPTFRGKAIRFNYELLIGTSHSSGNDHGSSIPSRGEQHRKKIMKIPIRIYNNVAVESSIPCYELLWPARKEHFNRQGRVQENYTMNNGSTQGRRHSETRPSAPAYVKQLLQNSSQQLHGRIWEGEDETWSCREAVEILTRVSRKVTYDIGKDDQQVALLTLIKSSYRVGETISGIVELNGPHSRAQVLKFSAFLEAYELVPPYFANGRALDTGRVHAEYHSTLTTNIMRLPFSLDVPSDATPAFRFSAQELCKGEGGLQWRIRVCFLIATRRGVSRHLIRAGYVDDWGVAWRAPSNLMPLVARASPSPSSEPSTPVPGAWSVPRPSAFDETVRDMEGRDWLQTKAETVECEIPLAVWPGNTLFRPVQTTFDA